MKIFYHPGYAAPIGDHIMPISKFSLVADRLREHPGFEWAEPLPVEESDVLRVHTPEYVRAVQSGEPRELAESQKFPWSAELYPSVCLTSGGLVAAAQTALEEGAAGALVSGFHHACADHGEGFCTFNGLIVALEKLRATGQIRRAAILDLDLHYGNGTASLVQSRDWIYALSLYGNDYWQNVPYRDVSTRHHQDGSNHESFAIPAGANGAVMQDLLTEHLPRLLQQGRPDVLLYQAGADPLQDDPYSPLHLTAEDLLERDRRVFQFARQEKLSIAWVLAGGYTRPIDKVVDVHVNTALVARDVYSAPRAK